MWVYSPSSTDKLSDFFFLSFFLFSLSLSNYDSIAFYLISAIIKKAVYIENIKNEKSHVKQQ